MRLLDTATGYGWVSILLHWITAVLILYLLYLGSTIGSLEGDDRVAAVGRHTSAAMLTYLLLVVRVFWRFKFRHPGPNSEQRGWAFTLGKWTHYAMLIAICAMLVSGPLMQWSYGRPIAVYDWFAIPPPFDASFGLAGILHGIHRVAALFIFLTFLLHIGGVYKHTAFNQDGTLAKIIIPGRESPLSAVAPAPANEEGDR
jgi:cytochrome b561